MLHCSIQVNYTIIKYLCQYIRVLFVHRKRGKMRWSLSPSFIKKYGNRGLYDTAREHSIRLAAAQVVNYLYRGACSRQTTF